MVIFAMALGGMVATHSKDPSNSEAVVVAFGIVILVFWEMWAWFK